MLLLGQTSLIAGHRASALREDTGGNQQDTNTASALQLAAALLTSMLKYRIMTAKTEAGPIYWAIALTELTETFPTALHPAKPTSLVPYLHRHSINLLRSLKSDANRC